MNEGTKVITTGIAKATEDGEVMLSVIIDNKFTQFEMKKGVAISLIKALAEALDELLHPM
jgi:hypothetical protein